jgi:hypothetical protein
VKGESLCQSSFGRAEDPESRLDCGLTERERVRVGGSGRDALHASALPSQ